MFDVICSVYIRTMRNAWDICAKLMLDLRSCIYWTPCLCELLSFHFCFELVTKGGIIRELIIATYNECEAFEGIENSPSSILLYEIEIVCLRFAINFLFWWSECGIRLVFILYKFHYIILLCRDIGVKCPYRNFGICDLFGNKYKNLLL